MTAPEDRPNPLKDAAKSAAALWATAATVVGALVQFGVLNSAQGTAITAAGEAVSPTLMAVGIILGGVVPLIGAVASAFKTASKAKPNVTPADDPRALVNGVLVPLTPEGAVSGPFATPDDGPRHAK